MAREGKLLHFAKCINQTYTHKKDLVMFRLYFKFLKSDIHAFELILPWSYLNRVINDHAFPETSYSLCHPIKNIYCNLKNFQPMFIRGYLESYYGQNNMWCSD